MFRSRQPDLPDERITALLTRPPERHIDHGGDDPDAEFEDLNRPGWVPDTDPQRTHTHTRREPTSNAGPETRIMRLPAALRSVLARPTWAAVLGVALLVVLAGGIYGVRAGRAVAAATPTVLAPMSSAGAIPGTGGASADGSIGSGQPGGNRLNPSGPPASGAVMVHVIGQVNRPGVVRLPGGSRVLDAIQASGGARSAADVTAVNLARPIVDGEQLLIPARGQRAPTATAAGPGAGASNSSGPPQAPTGNRADRSSGIGGRRDGPAGNGTGAVDLNSADATTLEGLPGVGPVLARRIIEWRTAHGRFSSIDELTEVTGIGEKLFERLRSDVRV